MALLAKLGHVDQTLELLVLQILIGSNPCDSVEIYFPLSTRKYVHIIITNITILPQSNFIFTTNLGAIIYLIVLNIIITLK